MWGEGGTAAKSQGAGGEGCGTTGRKKEGEDRIQISDIKREILFNVDVLQNKS